MTTHLAGLDRRMRIALRILAAILAVLSIAALAVETTARRTVLDDGYYQRILDGQDAYDRLYDQVLVDPASAAVTRDLLAQLPIPHSILFANLKVVLPPTMLRQLVNEQITNVVRYVRGDTTDPRVIVDLAPITANLRVLTQDYTGDLVASVQQRDEPDFPAFLKSVSGALDRLEQGQKPASLPTIALTADQQVTAQRALLRVVAPKSRAAVAAPVAAALDTGDVASALAIVGPYALADRSNNARHDLLARSGGLRRDVVPVLERAGVQLGPVQTARSFSTALTGVIRVVAILLALASLVFLWLTGPPDMRRRTMTTGGVLTGGGVLALIVLVILRWRVRRMLPAPPAHWPRSLSTLITDLQHTAAASFFRIGLVVVAIPILVGLLLLGGSWLWQRLASGTRIVAKHQRLVATGVGAVVVAALLNARFVPIARSQPAQRCLGSARMCGMRYDQAAFLATHNSMSTTSDRFLGPLQDPNIVSQLDQGARALLIDTYTWEHPDEIAAKIVDSNLPPDLKAKLPDLINMASPARPGLWLCHAVCGAGGIPLVPTLKRIGSWLDDHPGEIVTLIIQDEITGEQTAQAFARAGLKHLLYTPSANAAAPWPTLGQMVDDNKRLVVFAENANGPAPWYRNFYRYGMETPYAFTSPAKMSCIPNRGGVGKRLFLLNNFITVAGGSRLDAGEVNTRQFILDRAHRCEKARGHPVNFVAVDYASIGNARSAVDQLNAERPAH